MLKEQLERHGFEGIEIAFDAPTREWSSQLSHPAISLFLYDMREAEEHRPSGWTKQRVGDEWVEAPPPLVMEVSYAITAWAQAVEDEHRLLSQVLAVLYAFPELPAGDAQRPAAQRLPADVDQGAGRAGERRQS